jgi:hypothetical protein
MVPVRLGGGPTVGLGGVSREDGVVLRESASRAGLHKLGTGPGGAPGHVRGAGRSGPRVLGCLADLQQAQSGHCAIEALGCPWSKTVANNGN